MIENSKPATSCWIFAAVICRGSAIEKYQAQPEDAEANSESGIIHGDGVPKQRRQGANAQQQTDGVGCDVKAFFGGRVAGYLCAVANSRIQIWCGRVGMTKPSTTATAVRSDSAVTSPGDKPRSSD